MMDAYCEKGHGDVPVQVSEEVSSLTNDALYEKLHSLGDKVGPIVDTTRSLYEKRLQRLLNGTLVSPKAKEEEFSATEEEEDEPEEVRENTEEEDGGTPLQTHTRSYFSNRSLNSSETICPEQRSFEFSTQSVLSKTGAPVQMSLRSRSGFGLASHATNSHPPQGPSTFVPEVQPKSRGFSLAVKALIVLAVVAINVFIYANLEYFKSSAPSIPKVARDE
uniref:Lamina associated polypeptide isoform beta like n=1 Tax=Alectorobius mimon TaxID=360319 RepID=A0A147B9E7_9ACAR